MKFHSRKWKILSNDGFKQNQVTGVLLCSPWPVRTHVAMSGCRATVSVRGEVPETSCAPCFGMLLPALSS